MGQLERLSLALQSLQIGEDQLGQVFAVSSFENAEDGEAELPDRFAQPMEVLSFEGFLSERIAGIGIEARGNADQRGLLFEQFFERLLQNFSILLTRGPGRDGKVEAVVAGVASARPGIAGMLVNGIE